METITCGVCAVEVGPALCAIRDPEGRLVASFPLDVQVSALGSENDEGRLLSANRSSRGNVTVWTFDYESPLWDSKRVTLEVGPSSAALYALVSGPRRGVDPRISRVRYCPLARLGENRLFAPRFDWSRGLVHVDPALADTLSCQQWFSPPPFFYGIGVAQAWFGAGIEALPGQWNFMSLSWGGAAEPGFSLDYEGHASVARSFRTPTLRFDLSGHAGEFEALEAYTEGLAQKDLCERPARPVPSWWREPLFCGWGEQRLQFRKEHGGSELGSWINAGDYSTEQFYRKNLSLLGEKGVNPGIVVIDCFWAEESARARPNPLRWADMRGFIDEQHRLGRKVLLWFSPILAEGLPLGACMSVGGRRIAADPESPEYRAILAEEIRRMISGGEGCLDADGFKIDFTQNIPSERGTFRNYLDTRRNIISERPEDNYPPLWERSELVSQHGAAWGCELVRAYIEAVRIPLKSVKEDALLVTHTANPRLADLVDMLRLNDMDGTSPDVLGIMGARARIAKACNPLWLIDTDNDLMVNREMWRKYMSLQPSLGNPDTYYASGIATSGESFEEEDYDLLRHVFDGYRKLFS